MKNIFLFSFLVLFSSEAFAAIEPYAIEREDGGVSVKYYNTNSRYTLEEELVRDGMPGRPAAKLSAVPDISLESDREFWKVQGNRIIVDETKKTAHAAAKAIKEARKRALLKMTQLEYEEAKSLGLVK